MKAPAASPTFLHGVVAAAGLAFAASALFAVATPFLGAGAVLRLAVPALAGAYLLWFFRTNRQRTGRVVTLTLWTMLAAVAWWAAPPLPVYLLVHAGAIWLVRSLYSYSGVIPAFMDLGLSALSAVALAWVFLRTGSVFLATWSFFGVQTLWIAIPARIGGRTATGAPATGNERFERASRQADAALRQLFGR
jgi:hypothetical protein